MKIFCIGRNYLEHIHELNNNPNESEPVVFLKPTTALLKDNKDFYYPKFSNDIQYEVEIVLKVCKNGKNIAPKFATNYFNELSLGIDFTARDIQTKLKQKGHPWEIAKAFDNSAVIGNKWLSMDKLDALNIEFELRKNSEIVQQGNSNLMIFSFEKIISYVSNYFTLNTGDLIFTGTPKGVGPIAIGDKLEGFIANEKIFECNIK